MQLRCGGSVIQLRLRKLIGFLFVISGFVLVAFHFFGDNGASTPHLGHGVKNRKLVHALDGHKDKDVIYMGQKPMGRPVMAMNAAKTNFEQISRVRKTMYAEQNRPSDEYYNLNVTYSDRVSLDRVIEDTRPEICLAFTYDQHTLPKATVIIPFYNEALSMLLRTVHSVLNKSPDHLLNEVILVDDLSTYEYLRDPLARYFRLLPKVRLIRNKKREGLIVSRLNGARIAKGPILIFLDAHTEANVGWLEPLLDELQRHPNSVIQPFVDGIDGSTIEYSAPPTYYRGAFSWDLRGRTYSERASSSWKPVTSIF